MEEKYNLELNVVELNTILSGLSKLPYEVSSKVIHQLQSSIQTQQQEREKTAKKNK